jgi:hypothetical protein
MQIIYAIVAVVLAQGRLEASRYKDLKVVRYSRSV